MSAKFRPYPRIIARLDIKGQNVIKGIHLEGLRVVGQPDQMAREYYSSGVDEIIYMDTVASLYNRNSILPIIERTAHDVFVPMTVGGGIRTLDDITQSLRSGADKVAINTAAIRRPEFVEEASKTFGSQCIVISIEAKRRSPHHWEALVDNGRERTGVDAVEWARKAQDLGAGEILLTSVDKEGTKAGFDRDLLGAVRGEVTIPVIASGGVGSVAHVEQALLDDVDAVACATLFHYGLASVSELKASLAGAGVAVRQ